MIEYMVIYTISFILILSAVGIKRVGFKQFIKNFWE